MEIDQNDLRTRTAIGFCASHEHYLRFFVSITTQNSMFGSTLVAMKALIRIIQ